MELSEMPVELLNEVFTQLRDDAIQDLLPVALVSRHFYTITVPLIYQNITLDISRYVLSQPYPEDGKYVLRPLSALATRLSAGPSVRALVRNVHVIGRMGASPEALELLQYWLPRFSQLISFSWDLDCPLPTTMLECLGRHWPSSHLHMRTSIAKCDIRKDRKTLELAPHMLRSLQVNMPNCGSREGEKEARITKQRFFWALNNCPGLQTLTTYFAWNSRDKYKRPPHPASRSSGPSGPPGLWHDIKLESPLPQLLELSVADRTFEVDDLLTWGAKGGWKKLKKITVWDHRLLQGFNGCEQSLRSIRLIDAKQGWEDNIGKICSRTMNLTELKIRTEDSRVPVSILEICGPSLTTLAIHHQDRGNDWSYIKDTPFKFLRAIQRLCPKDYLSALGNISQLTDLTLRVRELQSYTNNMSSLAMVEQALRYVIEDGGTENHLQSLTLQEGPRHPEWDNPWGAVNKRSSRVFQATRTTNAGEDEQNINRRQIEGPLKTELEQRFRKKEPEHAEKKTREYLDTMPPAVLSRMIEDNRIQTLSLSSGIEDSTYESRTSGWDAKLAEYEERWRKSSGILPMLEWQLQKRKRQGWKLWDMPLMQSDAGSEGFLYERMAETTLEG